MATEKQILAINKTLSTVLGLEPSPVNAALGEMPFVTDSRQKRSLMLSKMPATA
jgi:hypothetical protein